MKGKVGNKRGPLLLVVFYGLLLGAWMMGVPPGSAPDEPAHYIRAAAAGRGQVVLTERPPAEVRGETVAERWQHEQSRQATLPRSLSPGPFECWTTPGRLTDCGVANSSDDRPVKLGTYVGTYPAGPYLLPGAAMRLGGNPRSALRWGRLIFGMMSLGFLGLAAYALWDPDAGWPTTLGLIAITTPMAVYAAGTLVPSGVETASAICFYSCVLRVARNGVAPRWIWIVMGVSGVFLATARDLGLLWLAVGGLLLMGTLGWRTAAGRVKAGGTPAALSAIVVGLGLLAAIAWQLTVQVRPEVGMRDLIANLRPNLGLFQAVYFQVIGNFGVLDTPLPLWAYAGWTLLLICLIAMALWFGTNRQIMVLAVLAAGLLVLIPSLDAVQRAVGFGAQGRHVLPLVAALGLLAGEMITGGRDKLPMLRWLPFVYVSLAAALQAVSWFAAARRYAVGIDGPLAFAGSSHWSPPLGWTVWALVVIGAAAVVVSGSLRDSALQRRMVGAGR